MVLLRDNAAILLVVPGERIYFRLVFTNYQEEQ